MNEDDIKTPGVGQCGICGATAHYMKWGQNVCADDENHVESMDEGWVDLMPKSAGGDKLKYPIYHTWEQKFDGAMFPPHMFEGLVLKDKHNPYKKIDQEGTWEKHPYTGEVTFIPHTPLVVKIPKAVEHITVTMSVKPPKAHSVPVLEKPLSKWGQAMREKLDGMKKSP